ncbi:DUF6455 family protein [Labrenzia sp. OB1]|uniref:DUF6455 family protein n=1 Tax=Labrenzia sp. OB1 TaxID=1561204 RepID=UPI0007B2E357|nr:DUF6455 family protein [Labrenzia sp. OB1]KZM47541.1 hypothetical protein OA90_25405 [Labrenzia sp. OB1]
MERLNERAALMGRMIEAIGAMDNGPAGVQTGQALRSAAIRCVRCTRSEACRKWLADHPRGADRAMADCPNASLFNSLKDQ